MAAPEVITVPSQISTVNEVVTQTSVFDSYDPGSLQCSNCSACNSATAQVPCNGGDWGYRVNSCCSGHCTGQLSCSKIAPTTCPTFPNAKPSETWAVSPKVNCTYNISDFKQPEDVLGYAAAFGKNQNYNVQIAPSFCSQTSTSCPADPNTGQPIPSCSMYWDTGSGGQICQSWANDNKVSATTTFTNYCISQNTPDCTLLDSPFVDVNGVTGQNSWWSSWGWLVIAIAALVIFIGLFIWFFMVMKNKSDEIERIKQGQQGGPLMQAIYTAPPTVAYAPSPYVVTSPASMTVTQPAITPRTTITERHSVTDIS